MAKFKISGVWTLNGVITDYAVHTVNLSGVTKGVKTPKADAVKLLSNPFNEAVTWLWDYRNCYWKDGEKIEVVSGSFLRSRPDGTVRDNLSHLINYACL